MTVNFANLPLNLLKKGAEHIVLCQPHEWDAYFCIFVISVCTSFSSFFVVHIQWHELEYTGIANGALHILRHTQL